jgi:hypothetical protein
MLQIDQLSEIEKLLRFIPVVVVDVLPFIRVYKMVSEFSSSNRSLCSYCVRIFL